MRKESNVLYITSGNPYIEEVPIKDKSYWKGYDDASTRYEKRLRLHEKADFWGNAAWGSIGFCLAIPVGMFLQFISI